MRSLASQRVRQLVASLWLALSACGEAPPTPLPTPPTSRPSSTPTSGTPTSKPALAPDHTTTQLRSREELFQLAAAGAGKNQELKFLLQQYGTKPALLWLDGSFYRLHDEWYWFRLLNGMPVEGANFDPVGGLSFSTIQQVYDWAKGQDQLPLDLAFVEDGRLYSAYFYQAALHTAPRRFGLGTLLYVPASAARPERWYFELEYGDPTTYEDIQLYFQILSAGLPPEIAKELRWLVRSPRQEEIAARMEREKLPRWDRISRYQELATPGEVEVYSAGLTAGHLRQVKNFSMLGQTFPDDILVMQEVPDYLPPAAGLITSVPQTPLAHIAILARNRNIPNAYRGGLLDDPQLEQLSAGYAPVIVRTTPPNQLEIIPITEEQLASWRAANQKPALIGEKIDPSKAEYTYNLSALSLEQVDALRPWIGGKSAGFLTLLSTSTTAPDAPLAISIRAYAEHLAPLEASIREVLSDYEFANDPRVRVLALEGEKAFQKRFSGPQDQKFYEQLLKARPAGNALGDMIRAGGLQEMIEDRPIAPKTLEAITLALQANFGHYAKTQALRFRSSSNIEDIEGFNGAGLYESFNGYLDPSAPSDEKEKKKTVERAILRVWASYWGVEAFEERRVEGAGHLNGHMAVVAHANFPDEKELSNGVFTLSLLPDGEVVLELNVQKGALSVTNPENKELPEVIRVVQKAGETAPRVERVRASTLSSAPILSDAQLQGLFVEARTFTETLLQHQNKSLPLARQNHTLTLDCELREVDEGWPALAVGTPYPRRLVVKQARSLEPSLRRIPSALRELPIPREALARAASIFEYSYTGPEFTLTALFVKTDPLLAPDLGYGKNPLLASLTLTATTSIPALGLKKGQSLNLDHTMFSSAKTSFEAGRGGVFSVELREAERDRTKLSRLETRLDGSYLGLTTSSDLKGSWSASDSRLLYSTPEEYLLTLIPAR